MRNERYRKNAISVRERHNERKNEVYSNPDVLLEYSHNNVIFKACEAATYREAMRVAPEQVQAFVLGICRRQQEEKRLNRQQRRQLAKGQDR